jgi:hypothetical protein
MATLQTPNPVKLLLEIVLEALPIGSRIASSKPSAQLRFGSIPVAAMSRGVDADLANESHPGRALQRSLMAGGILLAMAS